MTFTSATVKYSHTLEIQWNGSTWTDASDDLLSATVNAAQPELWRLIPNASPSPPTVATFTVYNGSGDYSPFTNTSGYLTSARGYGVGIRFKVSDGSTTVTLFTGVIEALNIASTTRQEVVINATDLSQSLLQNKLSDSVSAGLNTGEYISQLATTAGVASSSIDDGLFIHPYAWIDEENIAEEMAQVAHSEAGRVFFDAAGTLQFVNLESLIADNVYATSQHTFTTARLDDIAAPFDWGNVYNEVTVSYAPRVAVAGQIVYSLDEAITIAPGATETRTLRHKYPAYSVAIDDITIVDGGAVDVSADVSVSLTERAQTSVIELTNSGATLARVVKLTLTGTALIGNVSKDVTRIAASSDIGTHSDTNRKAYPVRNLIQVQTRGHADFLAAVLLDIMSVVRNTFQWSAPSIPTLAPGYRVTLQDTTAGINRDVYLLSITTKYGGGDLWASYEGIDAKWLSNTGDYFELGSSTLGAVSDLAFY